MVEEVVSSRQPQFMHSSCPYCFSEMEYIKPKGEYKVECFSCNRVTRNTKSKPPPRTNGNTNEKNSTPRPTKKGTGFKIVN
jgi:hypothetical protein